MLKKLYIENYALIDTLEIDFSPGFSVITGETGAGKSILLGALGLILGQRVDTSVLLDKSKKCIIEGHFDVNDYHLNEFFTTNELDQEPITIVRREINQNGKSRAFINDTPVNLALLTELGDHLVSIHSQHSVITLNNNDFQLAVLDDYAGVQEDVSRFREQFFSFLKVQKQFEQLLDSEVKSRSENDYFQFLFDELEAAHLKEGEQEEAEQRLKILSHAEEIKSNLYKAIDFLSGNEINILSQLSGIIQILGSSTILYPVVDDFVSRIKSNLIDLKDINEEIDRIAEKVIVDPSELEMVSARLDQLYKLEKKHHVATEKELIDLKNEFSDKLLAVSSLGDKINELRKNLEQKKSDLDISAVEISNKRVGCISSFEKNIVEILVQLGMNDARFKIDHSVKEETGRDGIDKVKFLFSSNKGVELDEISKIASGGELSRLMLSIKSLISQKNLLPTIIFDEIDSGISGEIAGKMGIILKKMAVKMQVIAITHLPQIAGTGDNHLWVYKVNDGDVTRSRIKKLTRDERIHEIAKMLSSGTVTDNASKAAAELLRQ